MEKRPTLKISKGSSETFTLLFSEPTSEGENQYGTWYLYPVRHGEEEKAVFASDTLHQKIQAINPRVNDLLTVELRAITGKQGQYHQYSVYREGDSEKQFEASLEKQTYEKEKSDKDEMITRTAVTKSLIESGRNKPDADFFADARRFVNFCETGVDDIDEFESIGDNIE